MRHGTESSSAEGDSQSEVSGSFDGEGNFRVRVRVKRRSTSAEEGQGVQDDGLGVHQEAGEPGQLQEQVEVGGFAEPIAEENEGPQPGTGASFLDVPEVVAEQGATLTQSSTAFAATRTATAGSSTDNPGGPGEVSQVPQNVWAGKEKIFVTPYGQVYHTRATCGKLKSSKEHCKEGWMSQMCARAHSGKGSGYRRSGFPLGSDVLRGHGLRSKSFPPLQ